MCSCGSTGVDCGAYRCPADQGGDSRPAQLGIQDHPPISGFPVRGRGLRGRTCAACGALSCLSEYLSAKVSGGMAQSTLRNVVSAVRGAEDLGILPPIVLPIHWTLAKAGQSLGRQPYFTPPMLAFLCQLARTREQRIAVGLRCLSYTLWLRVSAAAPIAPRDVPGAGMASFIATKVWGPSEEKHPLGRWGASWAPYLLAVGESADRAQLLAEQEAPGSEEPFADMLRDSQWSKLRWRLFRPGGCAACHHRGPDLRFLMWWGRWRRLQTALEYATRYNNPEVVGHLLFPMANVGDLVGTVAEDPVMDLWPAAMYAKETVAIKDKEMYVLAAGNRQVCATVGQGRR